MLLNRAIFLPLLLAGCAAEADTAEQESKIEELESADQERGVKEAESAFKDAVAK